MNTLKLFPLFIIFLAASSMASAAGKSKNQMSVQPVILAVSFETFDKNRQLLNTLSFDGEQKSFIVGDIKNAGNFKCECTGQFEVVPLHGQKYLATFLTFYCGEKDQQTKSKVGRLLIPVKDYQNFSKTVFLSKEQPEVVLKIKELSL